MKTLSTVSFLCAELVTTMESLSVKVTKQSVSHCTFLFPLNKHTLLLVHTNKQRFASSRTGLTPEKATRLCCHTPNTSYQSSLYLLPPYSPTSSLSVCLSLFPETRHMPVKVRQAADKPGKPVQNYEIRSRKPSE